MVVHSVAQRAAEVLNTILANSPVKVILGQEIESDIMRVHNHTGIKKEDIKSLKPLEGF